MKKRVLSLLLTGALLLSLTACASGNNASAPAGEAPVSTSSEAPSEEAASMEEKAPSQSYVFTDDCGREVEVPGEITSIVPSGSMAQIVLYALAPEMFTGLAAEWGSNAQGIIAEDQFSLPVFGTLYASADLNVEELALTGPQLIIDIGEAKKTVVEDMDALQEQTGIPSVFISSTLETMPQTYRTLGELLGKEEKAEELAVFCEKVYARTLSIMEEVGDNKVNALYVLGGEGLNVIASTSYHAELLDLITNNLAVVDNPLSKGSGNEVSMEQISLWNPDFVIFGPDSIYSKVKDTETWNQINAIVNGSYIEVPDTPHNWMSMPPSVQRYLGLIWLPTVLYPDYCDYDVKAEIMEYYRLFYGCELTDEQYESITANAFLK